MLFNYNLMVKFQIFWIIFNNFFYRWIWDEIYLLCIVGSDDITCMFIMKMYEFSAFYIIHIWFTFLFLTILILMGIFLCIIQRQTVLYILNLKFNIISRHHYHNMFDFLILTLFDIFLWSILTFACYKYGLVN